MFLGIDTSAYTTSVAVINNENRVLADSRIVLPVPTGQQGLRQSTALFYHMQNLPGLLGEIFHEIPGKEILAAAVSVKPRPMPDSYMPVFLAGKSMAAGLTAALDIPLIETSHQEGHLAAGLWSAQVESLDIFLALHLSGGTSELLLVEKQAERPLKLSINILGSTLDINAGQFIDRIGVAMGLGFPAGPSLEKKAQEYCGVGDSEDSWKYIEKSTGLSDKVMLSSAVKGYDFSFSGGETKARQLLNQGIPSGLISRAVEHCIAVTIEKILRKAVQEQGIKDVLVVGGVAANKYIQSRLIKSLEHLNISTKLRYCSREYSSDNAVGTALIARSSL